MVFTMPVEEDDKIGKTNIKKLLISLRRAATAQDDEVKSNSSDGDIGELLEFLRNEGRSLCEAGSNTVTITRKRAERCSFCKTSLAGTVKYVRGETGATLCIPCLDQINKMLEEDNPEI